MSSDVERLNFAILFASLHNSRRNPAEAKDVQFTSIPKAPFDPSDLKESQNGEIPPLLKPHLMMQVLIGQRRRDGERDLRQCEKHGSSNATVIGSSSDYGRESFRAIDR